MGTALLDGTKRTALREPVPLRIIGDPVDDGRFLLCRDTLIWVADALQNVVHILGDAENTGPRLRNCAFSNF